MTPEWPQRQRLNKAQAGGPLYDGSTQRLIPSVTATPDGIIPRAANSLTGVALLMNGS
jgi:hypothetical protein